MSERPENLKELFDFYYERFKPIYAHVESLNQPPTEMFFEINAAFDHLSRIWKYDQSEEEAIKKVASHLKRGTFDAFKIILRETRSHYDELRDVDLSIVDNGHFQQDMIHKWNTIRELAVRARQMEGDTREEHRWNEPFDLWEKTYTHCVQFDDKFYRCDKVDWAKTKNWQKTWWQRFEGFLIGVLAGLVVSVLLSFLGVGVFHSPKPGAHTKMQQNKPSRGVGPKKTKGQVGEAQKTP